jgi:hypothetical protein
LQWNIIIKTKRKEQRGNEKGPGSILANVIKWNSLANNCSSDVGSKRARKNTFLQ